MVGAGFFSSAFRYLVTDYFDGLMVRALMHDGR